MINWLVNKTVHRSLRVLYWYANTYFVILSTIWWTFWPTYCHFDLLRLTFFWINNFWFKRYNVQKHISEIFIVNYLLDQKIINLLLLISTTLRLGFVVLLYKLYTLINILSFKYIYQIFNKLNFSSQLIYSLLCHLFILKIL